MTTETDLGRRVAVSAAAQVLAKVAHLGLNVVSTLAIIRYLSPDSYGSYVLVATVTTLIGLAADFGLAQLAVREVAAGKGDAGEVIGTVLVLRLTLAVGALGVTQVVLFALRQPAQVMVAAAVASAVHLGNAVLPTALTVFQVRMQQHYDAIVRLSMEAGETALVLYLVSRSASLAWLFLPPSLGAAAGAAAAVLLARRRCGLHLTFAAARVRRLLVEALPIGPALLIGVVYLRLDGLTLAVLRPERDLGLYGSAYQPIEYAFLATAVLINVVFPLLARAFGEQDLPRFVALYRRGTEALIVLTLIVPVLLLFVATPVVRQVFGADYSRSAAPLRILAVTLVLMTVNAWQSLVLLAGGLQRITLRYNVIALLVAVALCALGVSLLGVVGAALATVGTAAYVLAASTSAVRRRLGARLDGTGLLRIAAAALATTAVLGAVHLTGAAFGYVILAGLAVYPALLYVLGVHRSFAGALA